MDFNKLLSGAKTTLEFGNNQVAKTALDISKNQYNKIPSKYKDLIEEGTYNFEDMLLQKGNSFIKSTNETEEFRKWLHTPLRWTESDKNLLTKSKLISPKMIGIGSVTVADYLYSMSQMNPNIIQVLDFSKINTDINTFEEIRIFVEHETKTSKFKKSELFSLGNAAKGYSIYSNVNEEYQESNFLENLNEEFYIPDSSPLFDQMGVEDIVGVGIPIMTMATSSYKAFKKYDCGLMSEGEALKYVAMDTVAPAVGSFAGMQLGFAVGTMLAPVTGGISVVIGPVLGGIVGFIFGKRYVRSSREEKIFQAYKVLQNSLTDLTNRTLSHKNKIRDFLAETSRKQRMTFRKIMVEAVLHDGIKLGIKEPSYNYIVLSEIANKYKEDSTTIWDTRKRLTKNVLDYKSSSPENQVKAVVPYIFENRGAIELSEPSFKPLFDEALYKLSEFNRIKEIYS